MEEWWYQCKSQEAPITKTCISLEVPGKTKQANCRKLGNHTDIYASSPDFSDIYGINKGFVCHIAITLLCTDL